MLFTILVLQDYPEGYFLSYFLRLLRALSLSRMLAEFSVTCIFHNVFEKFFNLWCSHSYKMNLLMPPFPTQKSWQKFLKICFSQQQKEVEKTIIGFIKIQSENMKITWNIRLIFCMICNFSKCDGFTVNNIYHIV